MLQSLEDIIIMQREALFGSEKTVSEIAIRWQRKTHSNTLKVYHSVSCGKKTKTNKERRLGAGLTPLECQSQSVRPIHLLHEYQ